MWPAEDDMYCAVCIIFLLKENSASLMLRLTLKPLLIPLSLSSFSIPLSLVHYWWFRLHSVLWLLWGSHRHRSNRWVFWTTGKWKKEKNRKKDVLPVMSLFCQSSILSLTLSCVFSVCLSVVFTYTPILMQVQITSFTMPLLLLVVLFKCLSRGIKKTLKDWPIGKCLDLVSCSRGRMMCVHGNKHGVSLLLLSVLWGFSHWGKAICFQYSFFTFQHVFKTIGT